MWRCNNVKCRVDSWLEGSNGANTISVARSAVAQLRSCEDENDWRVKLRNEMNRIRFAS